MQSATANVVEFDSTRRSHSRPVREPEGWRDRQFNDVGELCRFLADEIQLSKMKYSKIAALANVHPTTISNIAHHLVTSPRASTVLQILRALGFEVIVRG